jgi:hypothetical protein
MILAFALAMAGVPYVMIPHYSWVSIFPLSGMVDDSMHLMDLGASGARSRCGGQGATMVMLTDHGVPMRNIWAPPGASTTGFVEVYWDGNGDSVPDGTTVYALNLVPDGRYAAQDDVYVSWGRQDDVRLVYLRPSGQIAVAGLGVQTLYRPTSKQDNPASGVIACGMDTLDPKTGHQWKYVSTMSRFWN